MRGFTFVEVLISIFVLILLGSIGVTAFISSRDSKNLDVITDGLDSTLELAKSDAIAGKNASNFGVEFDSGSYTYFAGSAYSAGTATNKVTLLPTGWKLSTTTSSGRSYIVFNHLTGTAQATGTITVSNIANASSTRSVSVGASGDITVIK